MQNAALGGSAADESAGIICPFMATGASKNTWIFRNAPLTRRNIGIPVFNL